MKSKVISIVICMFFLVLSGCGETHMQSSDNESIFIDFKSEYKYGLNYLEYIRYLDNYGFISANDAYEMGWDSEYKIPDIKITSDTEYIVNKINTYFFNNENLTVDEQTLIQSFNIYGINKDNQITAKWVYNNPYEAYHLLYGCPSWFITYACSVPIEKTCFPRF